MLNIRFFTRNMNIGRKRWTNQRMYIFSVSLHFFRAKLLNKRTDIDQIAFHIYLVASLFHGQNRGRTLNIYIVYKQWLCMHFFHGKVRSSPKYIRRYEQLLCMHFFHGKVCIQVHEKKYKKLEPKSKCMNSDFDCIFSTRNEQTDLTGLWNNLQHFKNHD